MPAIQPCNPVVADIAPHSDGLEVVCGSHSVYCISSAEQDTVGDPFELEGLLSGIALEDLDTDTDLEAVCATYGVTDQVDAPVGHVYVVERGPSGWTLIDSTSIDYPASSQPAIADLDGDGHPEIAVVSTEPRWDFPDPRDYSHLDIFTLDGSGDLVRFQGGRPFFYWGSAVSSPLIADTNTDGRLEIWFVDGEGYVHCLEYWEPGGSLSRWSSYQHDERHTGTYETPVAGPYPSGSTVSWWGDYFLTGDVDSTLTLRVQPGTTVRVAPERDDTASGVDPSLVELIVRGEFSAFGTEERRTRFISAGDTPSEGDWYGIRLKTGEEATGVLEGVDIRHACIGIAAVGPDSLWVHDCTIGDCQMKGIKCHGSSGESRILITYSEIDSCPIGMEFHGCAAEDIGWNIVTNAILDGMKFFEDYGSVVRRNDIQGHDIASAPTGVFVQGSHDPLLIYRNDISKVKYGIYCDRSYDDAITANTISGSGLFPSPRGMSFYDSSPSVSRNTLKGRLHIGFHVDGPNGHKPVLGVADDESNPGSCADTTLPRCNRFVPKIAPTTHWYVKDQSGVQDSVSAEANWWRSPEKPYFDESRFYGPVNWRPDLENDPDGREGTDGQDAEAPRLRLVQNRPNPFNPTTTVRYSIPTGSAVKLVVYDLAGREVRSLIDGPRSAGWHEVVWDGRNDHGERVASGVYFLRLENRHSILSRKVVLLK
ncbi:MAG: T9SS type A sorting domain-containing protein [Candidatus Eisenbacteria bacterium]|nr:T9SS type A sorting domain-containing protein [Candidatus Eisenbacteria bacterium]